MLFKGAEDEQQEVEIKADPDEFTRIELVSFGNGGKDCLTEANESNDLDGRHIEQLQNG